MDVTIRPCHFVKNRIENIATLGDLIRTRAVEGRGWSFPQLLDKPLTIDLDYVELETEFEHILEAWRFYQSGLFNHLSGLMDDWRDQSGFWPAPEGWKPGSQLGVEGVVARLAEIFLFASRLALSNAGDAKMSVAVKFVGLNGRRLYFGKPERVGFFTTRQASIPEFPHEVEIARNDLVANPFGLADQTAIELFRRFGWDATPETIRTIREEFNLK
jgi:hypothetical protein